MADSEQNPIHNGDPTEEVGPEDSDVGPDGAEVLAEDTQASSSDTSFSVRDELAEQFPIERIGIGIDPDDGLPTPMDQVVDLPLAPSFSVENLVCIADETEFVELFDDEVRDLTEHLTHFKVGDGIESFSLGPSECVIARGRYDENGEDAPRRTFKPDEIRRRFGLLLAPLWEDGEVRVMFEGQPVSVVVRPKREQCKHYARMVFANQSTQVKKGEFGHQIMYRNCLARRSVGGACMSLSNEAVYACEHRVPPDPVTTEKYLDAKDRERLTQKIEMVPLFGITHTKK